MKTILVICTFTSLVMIGCAQQYRPDIRTIFVSATNPQTGDGSYLNPYNNLQVAIDAANQGDQLLLAPGSYKAVSTQFIESLCGNCLEHRTQVAASRGFIIQDKAITIRGTNADSVELVTDAGYGVLFINSWGSLIEDVTVTGGKRDPDGNATDAAVVAKFSKLIVRKCRIINNDHQLDTVVVGIGGIFGREGSELYIENNYIYNNGWDGIALYRGAVATITDNHIEKGRGACIGITWDAVATVMRNHVSHYWKGIGSFGTSRVIVRNNIVKDCLGWGIVATGSSFMEATNNLIYRNGNCGFANWGDDSRGIFANNIVMANGWRKEWVCPCVGIWMLGKLRNFPVSYNVVFDNVAGAYENMPNWTDKYGNLSTDPIFVDTIEFHLSPDSPLIDAGHPEFSDRDGSPADIGPWGGQGARE